MDIIEQGGVYPFPPDDAGEQRVNAILTGRAREMLSEAPTGTKAPCIIGGHWTKVESGWRAMGGDVFPRPGGDWDGYLIYPEKS